MKIIFLKIKEGLVKILKKIWENLFFLFLFFLILDLIIGMGFFLKYYFYQEKIEDYEVIKIDQILLDNFSSQIQKREENFKKAENKTYLDPFKGLGD